MPTGTVKWFSGDTGFGLVSPDDQSVDLFVHQGGLAGDGHHALPDGTRLSYVAEAGDKGPRAVNVLVA
jgi:CspA family cold shock protein